MSLLHAEVVQRFGVLPNFFRLAPETPDVTAEFWQFARFGYLDNPLPSLFKERLLVRLSHFCEVRYCLARHVGFLLGQGHPAGDARCAPQSIDDVLRLLRPPLPLGLELGICRNLCAARAAPLERVPSPDTPLEQAIFACATHVFLQTPEAPSCLDALKQALSPPNVQHLLMLLAFERIAHFWARVHTELELEPDIQALLASHEALRACVLDDTGHGAADIRRRMLQRELADSELLHEVSNEMIGEHDAQALYARIVNAAARLMHSPFASMQVVVEHSAGCELRLLHHRGFTPQAAAFWEIVRIESASSCGAALRERRRIVIEDVESCPQIAGTADLDMYRATGIRAVQTTPLLTRSGALVGMLSTHWRAAHAASARELRLLDILARQAADLIEGRQIESALRERERKYRALFESIDEGFCILERIATRGDEPVDYCCLEANPAFLAHSGMADATGKKIRETIPAEPETWLPVFEEVLHTGRPARFESANGADPRVFELYVFRLEGQQHRLGVTFKDITRRKRREAHAALCSSIDDEFARLCSADEIMQAVGARIGAVLKLSTCLFIDIDSEQAVATVGHGWSDAAMPNLLGAHRIDDFIGAGLAHELRTSPAVVLDDAQSGSGAAQRPFAAAGLRGLIAVPFHRDGRWRFLMILGNAQARRWRDDEIEIGRELAHRVFPRLERVRAEQALRESEERLRTADRLKDEFLATLAHELRNPLAPIRNALHLLRLAGPQMQPEMLYDMLERQVTHVVRLVDDLLEVSRVSRGAIDLKREPVTLQQILRIAAETSRPLIEKGRHQLTLDMPDEPLPVNGDIVRLAQVFANILNNAAKYTDDGGRVELTARSEGDCAVVDVRDDGIGIDAGQLPRLFEMFAQVERDTVRAQGGLGIGLWLVRRFVEMHGGSVSVHSDGLGRGSCFSVRLPLAATAPGTSGAGAAADPADLHRRRMLVVDDNRDAADSFGMLLSLLGADVRVEHDGAAALATLENWQPSVVLLDLGMPGMTGYEVARRIRAERRFDRVLLVAVTGWGQEDDRQRTRAAGFDHHLVKPVGLEELQDLLGQVPGEVPAAADR